jgi:hypothetical protein
MADRKSANGPTNGFIILCDCDGDPQDVLSANSIVDVVFSNLRTLDKMYPQYAPHSAWQQCAGGFTQVLDRVEEK